MLLDMAPELTQALKVTGDVMLMYWPEYLSVESSPFELKSPTVRFFVTVGEEGRPGVETEIYTLTLCGDSHAEGEIGRHYELPEGGTSDDLLFAALGADEEFSQKDQTVITRHHVKYLRQLQYLPPGV